MSSVVMGPWATHMLSDFGADVVLVEPPAGDIMRGAGAARHPGMGAPFMHGARGKRSVVLDLKMPAARDAFLALVATADVVVHNIRRAALERLRIAYDDVARANPRVIFASLVGYGQRGPYAARPAYDDLIQGACGLAATFVMAGREPQFVPALVVDRMVGITAAAAIMAALVERASTGRGQAIEVPMFETMVEAVLADHLGGDTFVPAHGDLGYSRVLSRNRRPHRTADGHVCVLLYTERHWERFFATNGESERYANDARLSDPVVRARDYDHAYGEIARVLATRTTAYWLATLEAADIPVTPLNDVNALENDRHLQETGFFVEVEHPTEGRIRTMQAPVTFGAHGLAASHAPAPVLGEHTRMLLTEAGFARADVDALIASGAAAGADRPDTRP